MKDMLEIAQSKFFLNQERSYRLSSINQSNYGKLCGAEVGVIANSLKQLDKTKDPVGIFDEIVGDELVSARRRVAKATGQTNNFLGVVRNSSPIAPSYREASSLGFVSFDFIANIVEGNFKGSKTKSGKIDFARKNDKFTATAEHFGSSFGLECRDNGENAKLIIDYGNPKSGPFKTHVGELITSAMNWKKEDGVEKLCDTVAKLRWNLVVSNYFISGTSAMAEMLEAAIYKAHDVAVFPRKSDFISRDEKCFLFPNEQVYADNYLKDFHSKFQPTLKEEITPAMKKSFSATFSSLLRD